MLKAIRANYLSLHVGLELDTLNSIGIENRVIFRAIGL